MFVPHPQSEQNALELIWHCPHGSQPASTIRIGDYKLIRNYDHVNNPSNPVYGT